MASTYTTNLHIELIGTGEQSGTWGTTTNNNFQNIFEAAITGRGNPNFTTDANLTLTFANNVTTVQIPGNLYLNVTSSVSLTTTRQLIVPLINKFYVVENNTTGGQSITVKTAAGTGVTIANGSRVPVYVNGTDVVDGFTSLPISQGGTGANTLAGAQSNLQIQQIADNAAIAFAVALG
jgi:hypothetical protein